MMKECCNNCKYLDIDYGMEICKYWEEPMENLENDKCSKYKQFEDDMQG